MTVLLTNTGKDKAWDPDHSGVDTTQDQVRFKVHQRVMAAELHSMDVAVVAAEDAVVVAGAGAGVVTDITVAIESSTWENFNQFER